MTRPAFLGIGAPKAGTGWLDRNLRHHPGLWLPPEKEIHYFDRRPSPWVYYVFDRSAWFRRRGLNYLGRALRHLWRRPGDLGWWYRYLLLSHDDAWYLSLFRPAAGQLAGEITPAYASLGRERVARIRGLLPDIRMIYLLRNPIERFWSNLAMNLSNRGFRSPLDAPTERIWRILREERQHRRSDYLASLEVWEEFYPRERIFVGFTDQLRSDPKGLLADIYRFLGVEVKPEYLPDSAWERVREGRYPPPPAEAAVFLTRRYRPAIRRLHERFDNPFTAAWLREADHRLAAAAEDPFEQT